MKRVMVLANNLSQASFRLRVAALVPLLARRGIEFDVQVRPKGWLATFQLRQILRQADQYDAVLVQRRFLDPGDAAVLRKHARRVLYDIDDALMYHNRPVGVVSRWRTSRNFQATARIVDHVVAGNQYLADIFQKLGSQVSIVPTVVDVARYQVKLHASTDSPRLVWIGSRSTIRYLQQFLPALEQAARSVPGLRLLTIANAMVTSRVLTVEHQDWSEQNESAALCRGDIGIAPTPTDPWTLGKCGFKIVQYMASGLPVIASPVGANAELVRAGVTGYLPSSTSEWADAVAKLARDASLRTSMGDEGRSVAEKEYSLDRAADQWAEILGDL
jgi:hypothetical protein